MTVTKLTLEEILERIEGYHDFPECRGTASLGAWILSAAEGSQCWWEGAPTIAKLREDGMDALIDEACDLNDDDEITEEWVVSDVIDKAHEVCESEEAAYDAEELERRIDHICDQIDWDTQRVKRTYPRDFANEFDLEVVDAAEGGLDEDETRKVLENWLTNKEHYGDLLDELDTYSPW